VGPPDPSGYHPIRTVFQAVSLRDDLLLEPAGSDSLHCEWSGLPTENTVTKAWRLAKEYVGLPALSVTLHKRIPAESGLGGGSSDAAGLLRGLVALSRGRFTSENATEVAAAVGADVPFFLIGGQARGEGYGERLTPLPDAPRQDLVIVRPNVGVPTPEAYRALDREPRLWREFDPGPPVPSINDFELVAPQACHDAATALTAEGASTTLLCGSGSAVCGWFDGPAMAEQAKVRLAAQGFQAWACRTLTRQESLWTS